MDPTPWYKSPVFIALLAGFLTSGVHVLWVLAPSLAKKIQDIGTANLVDFISTGLGVIAFIATGIGAWYRARSTIAPLTLTKQKDPSQ